MIAPNGAGSRYLRHSVAYIDSVVSLRSDTASPVSRHCASQSRSWRIGSDINVAELFYTGVRNSAAAYLADHGWLVDICTTE